MIRNSVISETNLVETMVSELRRRLPPGWSVQQLGQGAYGTRGRAELDAALALTDPQGISATVILEAKVRPFEAWQTYALQDRWQSMLLPFVREVFPSEDDFCLMVVAPYVGSSARERLTEAGISYGDATGNMRFTARKPAVFIETTGASRNPWRETGPLRSLKGGKAGRAVRGMLDYRPPFGTRQLASLTGCAPAVVSRVAGLLEREDIVRRRSPRGPLTEVEWERLLRRWAEDYEFSRSNQVVSCIAPRGLTSLWSKLLESEMPYAVTGSFAARRYAPVAEPRLATIYVDNPAEAMGALGLRPADAGANVLLVKPFDPVVFERTESADGMTYVIVTQVAVDLLTGPGRGPAEADALIEWMRKEEGRWRFLP